MVKCERCGTGFGPIQAAVLEFCPRCKARDHVNVPLIVARVKEEVPHEEEERVMRPSHDSLIDGSVGTPRQAT